MTNSWLDRLAHNARGHFDEWSLSRADAREWDQVESLRDAGELVARWLEGDMGTYPGCSGRPDPETEILVPPLAALNRSGFLTFGSQPGDRPHPEYPAWQRAGVQGFTDMSRADRMERASADAGLWSVRHHGAGRWWESGVFSKEDPSIPGNPTSGWGNRLSRSDVKLAFDGYLHDELCRAEQVTVMDLEWGRNDLLWPALSGVPALEKYRDEPSAERPDSAPDNPSRERIEIDHRGYERAAPDDRERE